MAYGCPTIVSKVSSLPEVCGDASLYIDPNNSENIANAMIRLLLNDKLKNQLIRLGYQRVKKYTWNQSADGHLKAIAFVKSRGK